MQGAEDFFDVVDPFNTIPENTFIFENEMNRMVTDVDYNSLDSKGFTYSIKSVTDSPPAEIGDGELQIMINDLEQELTTVTTDLDDATAELDSVNAQLDDVNAELTTVTTDLVNTTVQLDDVNAELSTVTTELDDVNEDLVEQIAIATTLQGLYASATNALNIATVGWEAMKAKYTPGVATHEVFVEEYRSHYYFNALYKNLSIDNLSYDDDGNVIDPWDANPGQAPHPRDIFMISDDFQWLTPEFINSMVNYPDHQFNCDWYTQPHYNHPYILVKNESDKYKSITDEAWSTIHRRVNPLRTYEFSTGEDCWPNVWVPGGRSQFRIWPKLNYLLVCRAITGGDPSDGFFRDSNFPDGGYTYQHWGHYLEPPASFVAHDGSHGNPWDYYSATQASDFNISVAAGNIVKQCRNYYDSDCVAGFNVRRVTLTIAAYYEELWSIDLDNDDDAADGFHDFKAVVDSDTGECSRTGLTYPFTFATEDSYAVVGQTKTPWFYFSDWKNRLRSHLTIDGSAANFSVEEQVQFKRSFITFLKFGIDGHGWEDTFFLEFTGLLGINVPVNLWRRAAYIMYTKQASKNLLYVARFVANPDLYLNNLVKNMNAINFDYYQMHKDQDAAEYFSAVEKDKLRAARSFCYAKNFMRYLDDRLYRRDHFAGYWDPQVNSYVEASDDTKVIPADTDRRFTDLASNTVTQLLNENYKRLNYAYNVMSHVYHDDAETFSPYAEATQDRKYPNEQSWDASSGTALPFFSNYTKEYEFRYPFI